MKQYLVPLLFLLSWSSVAWAQQVRELNLKGTTNMGPIAVDPSGVIIHLKNGEKIQGLSLQPPNQIELYPLDGQLCSGVQTCNGQPPSMLQLTRVRSKQIKGKIPNADGSSMLVIVTNSGAKHVLFVVPSSHSKYQVVNIL
ncbi:MAG: hypothetical protein HC851_19925 [Acaryochloris sp. RU_4_1]|nr:hypothetical protein [Acaryochloris sp. RU_4_1]NJR56492.1 hypothetical protein [Acaryochloris sp. CRU_2_0]